MTACFRIHSFQRTRQFFITLFYGDDFFPFGIFLKNSDVLIPQLRDKYKKKNASGQIGGNEQASLGYQRAVKTSTLWISPAQIPLIVSQYEL